MITAQDYAGQQAQLRAACAEVARIKAASRPIAPQDGPPAPPRERPTRAEVDRDWRMREHTPWPSGCGERHGGRAVYGRAL
jgi:hypothetical protein